MDAQQCNIREQKVGHGLVVYGMAKFQGRQFTFQSLEFPVHFPCFAGSKHKSFEISGLKLQNRGPEIWQIHPPPFHTHILLAETHEGIQ